MDAPGTSSIHTPNAITTEESADKAFSIVPDGMKAMIPASPIKPAMMIQSPISLSLFGEASDSNPERNGSFKWWAHIALLISGLLLVRWSFRKWRK